MSYLTQDEELYIWLHWATVAIYLTPPNHAEALYGLESSCKAWNHRQTDSVYNILWMVVQLCATKTEGPHWVQVSNPTLLNLYMVVFRVGTVLIEFLGSTFRTLSTVAFSGAGLRIRQTSTVTQYVNHSRGETQRKCYESVRNVELKNSINTVPTQKWSCIDSNRRNLRNYVWTYSNWKTSVWKKCFTTFM